MKAVSASEQRSGVDWRHVSDDGCQLSGRVHDVVVLFEPSGSDQETVRRARTATGSLGEQVKSILKEFLEYGDVELRCDGWIVVRIRAEWLREQILQSGTWWSLPGIKTFAEKQVHQILPKVSALFAQQPTGTMQDDNPQDQQGDMGDIGD